MNDSALTKGVDEKFCPHCGKVIKVMAEICPGCGVRQQGFPSQPVNAGEKSKTTAILLCLFFGVIGVHRFYVGKIGTGILQLFTFGGFFIWALIDLVMIITGSFTDKWGKALK